MLWNQYPLEGSIQSLEQLADSEIPKHRLQAAFLQHSRGNVTEAGQLISTVGDLSSAAIQLSHEIINEIPANDPRWDSHARASILNMPGSGTKIKGHKFFLDGFILGKGIFARKIYFKFKIEYFL